MRKTEPIRECPWCGGLLEPAAVGDVPASHAGCGQLPGPVAAGGAVPETGLEPSEEAIARFRSAAEAGYFAHELDQVAEIAATINVSESFDGLTGAWQPWFSLHVAEPDMARAAELLADWLEPGGGFSEGGGAVAVGRGAGRTGPVAGHVMADSDVLPRNDRGVGDFADETDRFRLEAEDGGIPWWPVMLTLAAGSLVVWTARRWPQPVAGDNRGRPMKPEDVSAGQLPRELTGRWVRLGPNLPGDGAVGEQVQEENGPIEGEDRPVISIRSDARGTVIRSDRDGNGQFEAEYRFPPQAP